MVRETRHLWVGNLPDNIREDRIREHFKRYGRVQNVKILARAETAGVAAAGASGVCATVAFMDIKSASKAHNAEHVVDERTLTTEYYEPAAIPGAAGAPSAGSSPAGSGYSGSSSSMTSAPAPSSASRYHLSGGEDSSGPSTCPLAASAAAAVTWRGTNDSATDYCRRGNTPAAYGRYQRNNSTAPFSTPPSNIERTTPHHRWYASGERAGGESTPSTPGGGTESGRRRRLSGSPSSRSDSSSPEPSDTSRASTPHAQPPLSHHNNHRTPSSLSHQWASTANGRPLSICVRNLPTRSTDSSLKDGLYHEYKKHGKVVWVKVVGQNADRYAVVRFKKPSDVEKALEVSQDKLFFGCKISVAPHQSCDDDAESTKPYETDIDEYHPKATRTLFIGNLEKDVTQQQLRDKFKHFGRIIEIDIKKGSGGGAGYAFCQYASISSVVEAIRAMDGEYVGGSRVKLGFGKPVATACVWVDGLTEHTEKQVLGAVQRCGTATSVCVDRAAGAALVHFEQACAAGAAVRELRRVAAAASAAEPAHPRLCVDYASRECQEAFYEQLEKHGGSAALAGSERLNGEIATRYPLSTRHDSIRYEGCGSRSRASSFSRSASRTARFSALDPYDPVDYAADRRYRVYDETGTSPPVEDAAFEDRLQSVVVSPHRARRHRRDSSPEDRKHSKERHRSAGGGGPGRSRSGSVGRERHTSRRKHRRRHDGSGSRAGTPLRDEPDAPPAEPRRPPRDRPPLPMCLPLPKFAAQVLRSTPATPRSAPQPAPAPDSPPRPPSVSSSSGGSAPHSPSLEERIRSLDEKYEKWSGSRALADAPDRARLRHRLLEVDINEVKPSEVVSALLAKRSVFDEDTERLESVVRPPSPTEARARVCTPRILRYPPLPLQQPSATPHHHAPPEPSSADRPSDPRLNRPERPCRLEKLGKINESDYGGCRPRPRTPSIESTQLERSERRSPVPLVDRKSPVALGDRKSPPALVDAEAESRSRDSATGTCDAESKSSFDTDDKDSLEFGIKRERSNSSTSDSLLTGKSECVTAIPILKKANDQIEENKRSLDGIKLFKLEESADDIMNAILKNVKHDQEYRTDSTVIDDNNKPELCKPAEHSLLDSDSKTLAGENTKKSDKFKVNMCDRSPSNKDPINFEAHMHDKVSAHISKNIKDISEANKETEKPDKERYNHNIQAYHITRLEKENVNSDKTNEKDKQTSTTILQAEKKLLETDKNTEQKLIRNDREKVRHHKECLKDKQDSEKDKYKNNKTERYSEKSERRSRENSSVEKIYPEKIEKIKTEKDLDKHYKEKTESNNRLKHLDDKSRHEHHKRDRSEKDKKKEYESESLHNKSKKDEKNKSEKVKKEIDIKKEHRKDSEPVKSRKSSRDESIKEYRKDSTDSSTSRASHESSKSKDVDNNDLKDEVKPRVKLTDLFYKLEVDKEFSNREPSVKIKTEIKEEKPSSKPHEVISESMSIKPKSEFIEKHRHHSLDSPNVDSKRKERLNSCSSLPSNIGNKRRISSQDSFDSLCDEAKKNKNDQKLPERRDSKDSRSTEKHKTTKFSKGHFAKIIESKTKDDKKGQVKPINDNFVDVKGIRRMAKEENNEIGQREHTQETHNNLDFLALFELRSSEEDERQKALRKEMKEKKRIQQLQQIQELQMQQDAMQQGELLGKIKDDRKQKSDDKKKEAAREKRFSIDRKSREDKNDNGKKKNRKHPNSSDTSDSDEPKKHSIFDIIDDGPTYISMYDKVKARSCKNMQKQEEEKRQEKIKAKFSQLKQSRAKREEKKRSSWDEDSDSDSEARRKPRKSSIDNSSDEDRMHNKKRDKLFTSNIEFEDSKTEDYFSATNETDGPSKLTRKNSRSRIMSDSSDDDTSKSKSPRYLNDSKKTSMLSLDSELNKHNHVKNFDDQIKKNSLLNLFGKSDSDDSKLKPYNENEISYKLPSYKSVFQDLSSESESMTSIRNTEFRRKHKKKQKKHKSAYSDEENKIVHSDNGLLDTENRQKISDKQRRHSSKRDKRKEKCRESIDTDDGRDEKLKREKRSPDQIELEFATDTISNNTKRDGKMEDIFGPLSDVSDNDTVEPLIKSEISCPDSESNKDRFLINEIKIKEKEDIRRKRERRRKEKRWVSKDDDNSLDMDAVSKAIEARLFAESLTDEDNQARSDAPDEKKREDNDHHLDNNLTNEEIKLASKHEKLRRDSREKKKKKKKNKEERQNRKEHNSYHHIESLHKSDTDVIDKPILDAMLLDIPLPNDTQVLDEKTDDTKSVTESPSLPRLTESPPMLMQYIQEMEKKNGTSSTPTSDDTNIYIDNNAIEIEEIPMPPPFENIVKDISEVPLPTGPEPVKSNEIKGDNTVATLSSDSDLSEDAVRSISVMETKSSRVEIEDTPTERLDFPSSKVEKKAEEKPRAVISQEETADAVAALLGESFGGKDDAFSSYEEPENNIEHSNEIESTSLSTENIPEEDAEEMRQAVQNLNACEMELKPDTPVSDNDLLLIDTDTEEGEEASQDTLEKPIVNVSTANVTPRSTNISDLAKPVDEPAKISVTKSSVESDPVTKSVSLETDTKSKETDIKIQLPRRENVQIITSSATPVITSWTLTNNKILEPHVINVHNNTLSNKDTKDNKPPHITTNIVQIKSSQTQNVQINNIVKPVLTSARVSTPYQVISHIVRPQTSNMQPPTIKIPEPHVVYQKSHGIVISPRMPNDPRIQSPKASSQDSVTSPRLSTVPVLTSPQNINSSGMVSPNSFHNRSPGQVTVVRVQQPPLSPIQAMHLPPGTMAMVSPNRPNSVLVQTQGSPLHNHNRLPVTPILTPIPKQINVLQQNKGVNSSPLLTQSKILTAEVRKTDLRNIPENNKNENAKIILSPTSLQHNNNPVVMAQNRLISMQNAVHIGNINSPLHLNNKFIINKINPVNDKKDQAHQKVSEQGSHSSFVSTPIIHVAGVNHAAPSIIQSNTKSVVCNIQEAGNISRGPASNVIHTLNSQRLLTPVSLCNVRQLDVSKVSPSVLSMSTIRPSTVLTKLDSRTTSTMSNVTNVTPILIKSGATIGTIRIAKPEKESKPILGPATKETKPEAQVHKSLSPVEPESLKPHTFAIKTMQNTLDEMKTKCETDFEELLKDNTNKIIVAKDSDKKVEVCVGKSSTFLTPNAKIDDKPHLTNTESFFSNKEHKISDIERKPTESSLKSTENKNMNKETDDTPKTTMTKDVPVIEDVSSKEKASIENIETTDNTTCSTSTTCKDSSGVHTPNERIQPQNNFVNKAYENVSNDICEPSYDFMKLSSTDSVVNKSVPENSEHNLKTLDENDSWSAKDLNIESVIKKVDSLCNDLVEPSPHHLDSQVTEKLDTIKPTAELTIPMNQELHSNFVNTEIKSSVAVNENTNLTNGPNNPTNRRGGRNVRGKKSERNQDRVQTRQIAKTPRGGAAKRGRGRGKADKSIKNVVTSNVSTMPGDVYDFHEDSGDESASNKTEPRPRLILTIKSPLAGQAGVTVATSSLSITPKDQTKFEQRRPSREEKSEDFVSPSPNTRKSRRLQEKDVHRNFSDDSGEDGPRNGRAPKRKTARQATVAKPANCQDKGLAADTRKSPRGTKRTRDRSISDNSVDSADGEGRREEIPREAKEPRLDETARPRQESEPVPAAVPPTPASVAPVAPAISLNTSCSANVIISHVTSTSAPIAATSRVASTTVAQAPPTTTSPTTAGPAPVAPPVVVATAAALATPAATQSTVSAAPPPAQLVVPPVANVTTQPIAPTPITKPPKKMISEINAKLAGTYESIVQHRPEPEAARDPSPAAPATGEAQAGDSRRPGDGAMLPVGATEAADARVLSPALPHRQPLAQRAVPDRPTPAVIRGGEGETGARYRALVAGGGGAASLPRGAHHPPPELPHAKPLPVTVVGQHHLPHHHHPHHPHAGATSRITSVPSISPQGQMAMAGDLVRSPPPAHQQTSPVAAGDGMYSHFSPQHFQMYQQHFRATQHESRATPSPFTRMEGEGCEAPASPLELRRLSARVPRPAHSPSPADRHIMYAVKCGRSPPPAHGGAGGAGGAGVSRLPGALPPAAPGPPHASQVPHEADSLQMLLRRYPVMWQGLLALKNDSAAVQMHFVGGNPAVASETLALPSDLATPLLRIAQRMRLEPVQLDQVHRKMKLENEHCILLALPCGRDHMDVLQQSTNLTAGFITYLQRKQAAGIVNIAPPGHHQAMFTVHIFPSCDFANENLSRIAPDLMHRVTNIAHLLIVIATV